MAAPAADDFEKSSSKTVGRWTEFAGKAKAKAEASKVL
jgi:hypothetical protein